MLEIIAVVFLAKKLAAIAKAKGRSAGWAALGPVLWIGGEITGAVVGFAMTGGDGLAPYGFAIMGAIIGAVASYLIVNALGANEDAMAWDPDRPYSFAPPAPTHHDPNNPYAAPGGMRPQ